MTTSEINESRPATDVPVVRPRRARGVGPRLSLGRQTGVVVADQSRALDPTSVNASTVQVYLLNPSGQGGTQVTGVTIVYDYVVQTPLFRALSTVVGHFGFLRMTEQASYWMSPD